MTQSARVIAADAAGCWHCGGPVPSGVELSVHIHGLARPMCCHGCQSVARLITGSGLDRYYEFRDALPERPASGRSDCPDYAAWDRPAVLAYHGRERPEGRVDLTLVLENVHCAACTWLLRRYVGSLPGVHDLDVDLADGRAMLVFEPARTALSEIAARLAALGYRPHLDAPEAGLDRDREQRREQLKALLVAGLGMVQVMSYALAGYIGAWQDIDGQSARFLELISMLVAVPVALYSGRLFYRSAWSTLAAGRMGMDVPVAVALLVALTASVLITLSGGGETYFDSVVMFLFFLLLGRYAVVIARQRAGRLHSALARALPSQVRRLNNGRPEQVALIELAVGDRILIGAGETVAADGRIVRGGASVDESLLSGESLTRHRAEGDRVLAGSLLSDGQIEISIERLGQDTTLSGIVRLLDQGRRLRPRLARLADRIAGAFVAVVLTAAVLAGVGWWLVEPIRALPVALAVLVVSCPCALALGTPVALAAASRAMARLGILIQNPDSLESLSAVTHLVFDKTGTLTRTDPELAEVRIPAGLDRDVDTLKRFAARLERVSRHPLAKAFTAFDDGAPVEQADAVAGQGVRGLIDGVEYRLGRPEFALPDSANRVQEPGPGQWLALSDGRHLLAWFCLELGLRDGAGKLVRSLIDRGLCVVLASGDRRANVGELARTLGIEQWHAEMSPRDKLDLVGRLQGNGARVAMIGDGINDAPVLAGANVSISLAEGADITRTQADLVVTGPDLDGLAGALNLAPRVRRIVVQNLAWALAYNGLAMPLAMAGLVPPWAAAIGMSASSLLVVMNAQRLARQ